MSKKAKYFIIAVIFLALVICLIPQKVPMLDDEYGKIVQYDAVLYSVTDYDINEKLKPGGYTGRLVEVLGFTVYDTRRSDTHVD